MSSGLNLSPRFFSCASGMEPRRAEFEELQKSVSGMEFRQEELEFLVHQMRDVNQHAQTRLSQIEEWMNKEKHQIQDSTKKDEEVASHSSETQEDGEKPEKGKRLTLGFEHGDLADQYNYKLSDSTWDASIWLFTPALGSRATSLFMLLLLAFTVFMQSLLVLTVVFNFTSKEYGQEELAGLHRWRLRIAHDVLEMSDAYPVSVATRVCEQDVSASTSADQFGRAGDLKDYFDHPFVNGELLCMLAICAHWIWTMQEILLAMDLGWACGLLPERQITEFSLTSDGCEVLSMHPIRVFFAVLIAIGRAVIAALLLVVGTMWLAHTSTITDLFLNSVALVFILDVDEIIYRTLVPARTRWNLQNFKPLKVTRIGERKGLDIRSLTLFSFVSLGAIVVWRFYVRPLVDSLHQAENHLCGGNTDFVYGIDPLGMAHVFPTKKFQDVIKEFNLDDPVLRAVKEAIDNVPDDTLQFALFAPSLDYLWHTRTMSKEDYADYISFNLDCEDMLVDGDRGTNQHIYRNHMRFWVENANLESCPSLSQNCMGIDESDSKLRFMTRLLCPTTCGCSSWQIGTLLTGKKYGCPSSCSSKMKKELQAQKDNDCWEPTVNQLRNNQFFSEWVDEHANAAPNSTQLFYDLGCSALRKEIRQYDKNSQKYKVVDVIVDTDLCHGQGQWSNFKPLASLCPLSCNCTSVIADEKRPFCPARCSYSRCKRVSKCVDEYKSAKNINGTRAEPTYAVCLALQDFIYCLDFIAERCPPEVQEEEAYWVDRRKTSDLKQDMFYWMGHFGLNCTEILGFEEHPEFHQRVWEGWSGSDWKRVWQNRVEGKLETFVLHMGPGPDYCGNANQVLSEDGSAGMADCESKCAAHPACEFFSIWATGGQNLCRTSPSCNKLSQLPDHSIVIYKKLPEVAEWTALSEYHLEASTTLRKALGVDNVKFAAPSMWHSNAIRWTHNQWVKLVAPSSVVISGFRVKMPEAWDGSAFKNYKFQSSNDGSKWTDVRVGIGENQDCCDWHSQDCCGWQEILFSRSRAKYWRLYMVDNYGYCCMTIMQMEVRQEPEKSLWEQYGSDYSMCNEKVQFVVNSWHECKREAENAVHKYFWFAAHVVKKYCGTGGSCDSPVTGTRWDWRIYKQENCPSGYEQLGAIGAAVPWWGITPQFNKAASLDDCKFQCDQRELCGAFEWVGRFRWCTLNSWAESTTDEQRTNWHDALTCAKPLCADDPDWVDKVHGNGTTKCNSGSDGGIVDNLAWCTDYGQYSEEAHQACPVACGVCKAIETIPDPSYLLKGVLCTGEENQLVPGDNNSRTFRCNDGWCLPMMARCNGIKNCDSDEWDCQATIDSWAPTPPPTPTPMPATTTILQAAQWTELSEYNLEASTTWRADTGVDNVKSADPHIWHSGTEQGFNQWIKLVAPSSVVISGFRVKMHPGWDGSSFKNYKFQSSNDGSKWKDVRVGIGENQDCCRWQEVTFSRTRAKYWRLYMVDNYGYCCMSIMEMEVRQGSKKTAPLPVTDGLVLDLRGDIGVSRSKWRNQVSGGPDADVPSGVSYSEADKAFQFPGKGEVITVRIATNPAKMQAVTYSAWVKAVGTQNTKGWILTQAPDYGWSRAITISDERLGGVGLTSFHHSRKSTLGNLQPGDWSHMVGVWSNCSEEKNNRCVGKCSVYLNERNYSLICSNGYRNSTSNEVFVIGGSKTGDLTHNPKVWMTDVAVFNRALTDAEVQSLYMYGRPSQQVEEEKLEKDNTTNATVH